MRLVTTCRTWGILGLCVLMAGCGVKNLGVLMSSPMADQSEGAASSIDSQNFQSDVLENDQLVILDCWAPWCGPCMQLSPTIERMALKYEGRAVVAKMNIDDSKEIAAKYQIQSIPALLFFRGGQEIDRIVGVIDESQLESKIESFLSVQ
ncbi:MAG: thioredoxin [Planctomycetota bacterium]